MALFGAYKAGQAFEQKMTFDSMHEFNLSRMKQKTAKKLEMLVNEYKETTGPARVARVGKRQIGTPLFRSSEARAQRRWPRLCQINL
jgi:hypothetical protein